MDRVAQISRAKGGLIGHIIGDAFGVPYEFSQRGRFQVLEEMQGYMSHNQPPGSWSDDTSMMLCLMQSMIENQNIDCTDLAKKFLKWVNEGYLTPHGKAFGVGRTCLSSIMRFSRGAGIVECGAMRPNENGNGALMRILPLVFCGLKDNDLKAKIDDVVSVTHRQTINKTICQFYLCYCGLLYLGREKFEAYQLCKDEFPQRVTDTKTREALSGILGDIHKYPVEDIHSTGYVVYTLEASLWSFLVTENYHDCIMRAVSLGGDTDTVAAIAGGMAGLYYGLSAIPQRWINPLVKKDFLYDIVDEFLNNERVFV